ncbi:tolloid-like protein 2 [Haliotis cracherodii]|uniref:tolloid-like protein 2 n=1 Tax=Haliotis cracherodii TaxID=6455 RepID=UPI0039E78EB8
MNIHCFVTVCVLLGGPLASGAGEASCGVPLVATSADKTFTSPGYPSSYFPRQSCTWTITTEKENETILLNTTDSVLEKPPSGGLCDKDYVTVYNGQNSSNLLGTFCGNQQPVLSSGGNSLRVHLQTDDRNSYKGFKMQYKAVPATTCNVTMTAGWSPIQIVSPGYPNNYQSGLDCQWTISAPYETNIIVEVLFFDMETVPSCLNDFLLFKDGTSTYASQLAKICEATPSPIISTDNKMTIIFHSDSSVTGRGFRLQYTNEFTCGSTDLRASLNTEKYLNTPGYPRFLNFNLQCAWTISAPVGYRIQVELVCLYLQQSTSCVRDYLLFSDGLSSNDAELGKYCGYTTEHVINSSNHMTITFHTDGSTRRRGFSMKYKAERFLTTTTEAPHIYTCGTPMLSASASKWSHLSSPGYPSNYENNVNCSWEIAALVGNKISVEIVTLSVEQSTSCENDYLLISDGSSSNSAELGKYCGSTTGNIVSSNNHLTITFYTNGNVRRRGFTLKYMAIPSGCGDNQVIGFYETTYIESPNYPMYYPQNANCAWTISTNVEGYVIYVEAVYFNLEGDAACSDYVKLFDVFGSNEQMIGRWCGFGGPNTMGTGMAMRVRFHSDGSSSYKGFKLAFTAGKPQSAPSFAPNCGGIIGGILGGFVAVVVATICCFAISIKKKSSTNDQSQRSKSDGAIVTNVFSVPIHNTATTATTQLKPPPAYTENVKDDLRLYCQAVGPTDIQPLVTSSPSHASAYQGIDNPAGPS